MIKVISADEWYPIYTLDDPGESVFGSEYEVSEALVARYEVCLLEFTAIQNELKAIAGDELL